MNDADRHLLTVFSTALERDLAGERSAYLDEACAGDPGLRDRVEALLRAHGQAGGFLEPAEAATVAPSAGPPADATERNIAYDVPSETPGATIGPYRLLQVIGEGGMGTVYVAEQTAPVRRVVALKVIKPGMDTGQVVARFEAERQALALMDHPSIAKVLDAGATDTGRPFFVMELVRGVPITEYCDTVHLTLKERLELFVQVCAAVQHAHQKGIIHRDIKPSNVLVAMLDGKPVPKVIDFGIAKATDQRLTERSLFTQHGAIVGTLEYMSPEQAEMSAMGVDTRTDVYALGVMLYELLTGSTPLERARLRESGYAEILRRIREEEPPKPSTRLSESRESLSSVATQRRTEPSRLTKLVRGDLDWIVMKSIEKDRVRRYETANGLARDIQRYLNGDAVEACPPSTLYKLSKFARKHRVALATSAAFAVLLMAATSVSVGLALWANGQRIRAESAESAAKTQQGRAQEREQMAIDAVKRFRDSVADEPELKNTPALEGLRKKLLKEPLNFFRTLRERLQVDADTRPESLARLARATSELGSLTAEIGDQQDALIAYREAMTVHEKLMEANPDISSYKSDLARCHRQIGVLLNATGNPHEAMKAYQAALAIQQKLAETNPNVAEFKSDLARTYGNLGLVLRATGKRTEAMKQYEAALAIQQRLVDAHPQVIEFQSDLGNNHLNMGSLLRDIGKPARAMGAFEAALAIRRNLAAANPKVIEFQKALAGAHNNIGMLRCDTEQPAEALSAFKAALSIRRNLADANPSVTALQSDLAAGHNNIGTVLIQTGKPAAAMKEYAAALAIQQSLADAHPDVTEFQSALADSHHNIGRALSNTGKPAEAMKAHIKALSIRRKLAGAHPDVTEFQSRLAMTHGYIGHLLQDTGETAAAMKEFEAALAVRQGLVDAQPEVTDLQASLAYSHTDIGDLQAATDKPAAAMKSFETALAILKKLVDANPSFIQLQSDLANGRARIGRLCMNTGDRDGAMKAYEAALIIQQMLAIEQPEMYEFASNLGGTLNNVAWMDIQEKRFEQARNRLQQAIAWQKKALVSNPANPTFRTYLDNHLVNLVRAARGLGDFEAASDAERELARLRDSGPRIIALDARLDAVLKGHAPRGTAERLQLALRAHKESLYVASTRFFAEALANDSSLTGDRPSVNRFKAACVAALAASGLGSDDPPPDDAAKVALRKQALDWLRAELSVSKQVAMAGGAGDKEAIAGALTQWKADADLAGIRDEQYTATLSDKERAALGQFWREVDAFLIKVRGRE